MISLSKTSCLLNEIAKRFVWKRKILRSWPSDWVPFHWDRPIKEPGYVDKTDLVNFKDPELDEIMPEFSCSEELKKLSPDDPLRKIFSADHARGSRLSEVAIKNYLKSVGLIHEVDHKNSNEAKVINLTFKLRKVKQDMARDRKHFPSIKMTANVLKHRRIRYMSDLRELHRDRFERLMQRLQIEPKDNLINVPYEPPFRKIQMRKLTLEYVADMKEKKVDDFMASLADEKVKFEEEKKKTLAWIEQQEKSLGVTV